MRAIEILCTFLAFGSAVAFNSFKDDPEEFMTAPEIIRYWKYPCEIHHVTTKDGYILELHRIPHGLNGTEPKNGPVLLQHGILGSSADWVMNVGHENLAFLMADRGYDVWLGNIRGNSYSKNHTTLNPYKDIAYWKFSWAEMGLYDAPSMIDYILDSTNQKKIPYVGFSMGTTMMFSLLSTSPEYNEKISGYFAMAPVAHMEHTKSVVRLLAPFVKIEEALVDLLGRGELKVSSKLMEFLGDALCVKAPKAICKNLAFVLLGYDRDQFNSTRAPVYLGHHPDSTSTQTLAHYAQVINSKKFQMYDYGAETNIQKYSQITPPEYNLTKITTPTYVFWGESDKFADKEDVAKAVTELKSLQANYRVPFEKWSHQDFQIAIHAEELVYDELLKLIQTNNA